ncbi:MAG TPA: hypothetical protein VGA63_01915 [Geopsychrobacteraceae bacterium]|jgi:predicted metal-binding protein
MSEQYKDKFSEATEELPEKSAFICESCNRKYHHKEAEKKEGSCCGRPLRQLVKESFGP